MVVVRLGLGMEMMVNEKRRPTTPGDLEISYSSTESVLQIPLGALPDSAIAVDIRECRRSSVGHQVGDLGKTTLSFFTSIHPPDFHTHSPRHGVLNWFVNVS